MHTFIILYINMILLADSGSTKVHWRLLTQSGQFSDFFTDGINPMFQTTDAMRNSISNQLLPQLGQYLWAGKVDRIFFYGAGCTEQKRPFVEKALQTVFRSAQVMVSSDMLGAARALLQRQSGIACILGTGSGSCYYDGEQIACSVPSLGYILGDEGSAAVLGRTLVGDVLKKQLSEPLCEQFFAQYQLTTADILEKVYRQPFPNRFLASLSRFCADHIEDQQIQQMLIEHFSRFISRNLPQYFQHLGLQRDTLPIGFVGSIAYYYQDILRNVVEQEGYVVGQIMQDPINALMQYHQ